MKKLIFIIALAAAAACACCAEKSIAEYNPDFENTLIQAMKPKNYPGWAHYQSEVQPLVLFHFSDIHSDGEGFDRYIRFYETYEKYFDDAICTGDLVEWSYAKSDFSFWAKTPGHEKILFVIGNHDTLRDHKDWKVPGVWDDQLSMQETYDGYFAANIGKWGVVYEKGKTYWYKDYPEKKVRMVGLDCMLRPEIDKAADDGQYEWFKKVLADAKTKDLSVIMAYHVPPRNCVKIKCNFTDRDKEEGGINDAANKYQAAVDEFMKSGGKFVMWLAGHTHWEELCYNKDYPKQLFFCIDSANWFQSNAYSFFDRRKGTKFRDLADAVVVDTSTKTVKMIRVGANLTSDLVPRNGITINYETGEIISQY
ncbi:MAG: metallophosphoesterase [Abditibacteriota bacterium]|nr:metallophosphoesterase [Abditibacteriota bacterium]